MITNSNIVSDANEITLDALHFDDWIIGETCSFYMRQLQQDLHHRLDYRFLKGAMGVAVEVLGARYDWAHASAVYAGAGRELGLDANMMDRLLELAWRWARVGVRHWTDLVRQWVCVGEDRQFYHLPSGEAVTQIEFGALFDHLSPIHDWPIVPFLLGDDHIALATHVSTACALKSELRRAPDGSRCLIASQNPSLPTVV